MKKILLILLLVPTTILSQNIIHPLHRILEVEPINSNEALGTGMLGIGDINNDGYPDIAVSAYNINKTLIYFGGPGILDSTADLAIDGGGIIEKGDINGDGWMDLVVQKRYDTLLVYYGHPPSPLTIDTLPDLILHGENLSDGYGKSFAIGDIDNDGFDELVVSAIDYGFSRGKVYVYLGSPHPDSIPNYTSNGDTINSFYGYTVKIADINGDGIADLAIGADERNKVKTLDVFYGHKNWTFNKNSFNQRLDSQNTGYNGLFWFNLADVNADGRADISFPSADSVLFIYGRTDSLANTPDLIFTNPDTSFYQGLMGPATQIGDINGDGKKDFALRAYPGPNAMCLAVYAGGPPPLDNTCG